VNGSFEIGTNPPVSGYRTLNSGDADITGWVIETGDIDWAGDFWQASAGLRSLDMNGGSPASVSQVISTVPGADYMVTFDMAGNPDCGEVNKTLDAVAIDVGSAAPVGSGSFSFDTTGKSLSAMGWTQKSFAFVAASASTKIKFTSTISGFCGPALDNVRVLECITPG
jgi:choice-of-anchor C domain-containing protein